MSALEILALVLVLTLGLAALAFWTWMLIDCIRNEPHEGHDRLLWVLVIVFTKIVGALIYFFVRRPERLRAEAAS